MVRATSVAPAQSRRPPMSIKQWGTMRISRIGVNDSNLDPIP